VWQAAAAAAAAAAANDASKSLRLQFTPTSELATALVELTTTPTNEALANFHAATPARFLEKSEHA
jgi:hypothetical protein